MMKRILHITTVAFTLVAVLCAVAIRNEETVRAGKRFYFVVSDVEHIEVGTELTQWDGGAGYPLVHEGKPYATYCVYFTEEQGKTAKQSVLEQGKSASLFVLTGNPIVLRTKKEKAEAKKIVGAFDSLYGCMQVLNAEIIRLERGATQQSSKRILQTVYRQLGFLENEYPNAVEGYPQVCHTAKLRLGQALEGVVYAKDLRYVLCELSVAYVHLSKNYSL